MASDQTHLLIGIHPVAAAVRSAPQRVSRLVIASEARNPRVRELQEQAQAVGIAVELQPRASLDRRCQGVRHQDVLAEFKAANLWTERDIDRLLDGIQGAPLLLVLDGVQDPHNLGACLRTAEAAGVHLVIMPKDRCAPLSAAARKAACGAAEVLNLVAVTNLARVLRGLKERGIWLVAAAGDADTELHAAELGGPVALVVGGEGRGLRRLTGDLCDFHVRIPMHGSVSSLNVSVATAVFLYEILRQRKAA